MRISMTNSQESLNCNPFIKHSKIMNNISKQISKYRKELDISSKIHLAANMLSLGWLTYLIRFEYGPIVAVLYLSFMLLIVGRGVYLATKINKLQMDRMWEGLDLIDEDLAKMKDTDKATGSILEAFKKNADEPIKTKYKRDAKGRFAKKS